jgi:putative transposase
MVSARQTYNMALRLINDGKAKPNLTLKKLVVTARKEDNPKVRQMKEAPADIRVRAVVDLIDAFKTARAGHEARMTKQRRPSRWESRKCRRKRKKKRKPFTIKYKSNRLVSDSFGFEPKSCKVKGQDLLLFAKQSKFRMKEPIRMSEEVRGGVIGMCSRVQYVYGRWYLLVPYRAQVSRMDEESPSRIGAYDAGVRTFLTTYSEEDAEEIGFETYSVIDRANKKIDGIRQRLEKEVSPKKRSKLRKAWYRANARATNLATDLHFKVIKHLLDKFDVLVAPRLNVQQLVSCEGNLKAITKRRLAFLAHGKFRMRLLMKAQQRNKVVVDLEEHGTSKTCCRCGVTNWSLGSSKVFKCKWCNLNIDRDINSAINHMIKFIFGTDDY